MVDNLVTVEDYYNYNIQLWKIYSYVYYEKREKGESLIFVIEKLLIIHIGLGYIYIYMLVGPTIQ